jgi:hypothetical protein
MDMGSVLSGGGLVTLILAIGGGLKWWIGRQDAKKDPIPKDQAAVALSTSAVSLAHAMLDEVRAEMSNLRNELAGVRGGARITESRLSAAESTIAHHESMFGAAMSYIEALLRHIRDGREQPTPPVPSELRDLIDPSLHD